MIDDDAALLRRFAAEGDEAAFEEFVRRNLGVVLGSAARRLEGDEHRAREVAQQVFISVARHAAVLGRHRAVAGWLFTATRNAALNLMRDEMRRARREQEATAQAALDAASPAGEARWEEICLVLERA